MMTGSSRPLRSFRSRRDKGAEPERYPIALVNWKPRTVDAQMKGPDVAAKIAIDSGIRVVAVKIQAATYELNVFLNAIDIDTLSVAVLPLVPEEKAICAGESCGAPAHWSRHTNGNVGIVMGFDDTTWDFGVWMPSDTFAKVKQLIAELRSQL